MAYAGTQRTDFYRPSSVWSSSTTAWTTRARNIFKFLHGCGYSSQWLFNWQSWYPVYINTGVGKGRGAWTQYVQRSTTSKLLVCDGLMNVLRICDHSPLIFQFHNCGNYDKYRELIDLYEDFAAAGRSKRCALETPLNTIVPLILLLGIAKW